MNTKLPKTTQSSSLVAAGSRLLSRARKAVNKVYTFDTADQQSAEAFSRSDRRDTRSTSHSIHHIDGRELSWPNLKKSLRKQLMQMEDGELIAILFINTTPTRAVRDWAVQGGYEIVDDLVRSNGVAQVIIRN